MTDRLRVLVIAEAANPEWTSVPLVGWSLAHALRAVADVHIVTQIRNRDAILRTGLEEGTDFTVIDSEALARPMHKLTNVLRMGSGKGWTVVTAISALTYPYFERLVWKKFGPAIKAGDYDIVHRVTPLTPTTVSPIAAKCAAHGVPFLMGPLNGGVPWPPGFDAERQGEREWLSYVRGIYRMLPGRRRMYRSTAAILAGSRHTASEVPAAFQARTFWIPENAIDPERFNLTAGRPTGGPLRACFVGRLVPYKGPDMLLEAALPLLKKGTMTLEIIGDGPLRSTLEAQVQENGTADAVTFHGQLPHRDVQTIMADTHILSFPSIREFGGGVVLEAMALGVVPVVVDYAGPGELVDESVGYKIPVGHRGDIIAAFGQVLEELEKNPEAMVSKSAAAQARVAAHFTWAAKAGQVRQVYDWVLDPEAKKPEPLSGLG